MNPQNTHPQNTHRTERPSRRRTGAKLLVLASAAALAATLGTATDASAHGTAYTPPSRNFSCLERWGDDFQDPAMATEDPMCWQAWQTNTNTMWNWNGLYKNGLAGQFQANTPDGTLCSGGNAQGGMYNSLDKVGDWKTTDIPNNFTLTYLDAAKHGADFYKVYVTKQGFDPKTDPVTWENIELLTTTGKFAPGEGTPSSDPDYPGTTVQIPVSAPGRTGHQVVFVIWQASHMDQTFFSCSDVNFTG
jgi:predicted carbohydrate-binding protein with CBM5 and CBM33 domain